MKRAIIIVIDSLGVGALEDAKEYNDSLECNTLANVAKAVNGLNLPNLQKLGLGNIIDIEGVEENSSPLAITAKLSEISKGKDTITGHWEIAGLILENPFKTYPHGFPEEIIQEFVKETGCSGVLGNFPASGTAIINDFGDEHLKTGYPIIYTSADSVFQIACHVDKIPIETLYDWCEKARKILDERYNISRVIARPFTTENGVFKRISKDRRDYALEPSGKTILDSVVEKKGYSIGIGKIEDIFVKKGITHAIHTGSNKEGINLTISAIKDSLELELLKIRDVSLDPSYEIIFTNLVDTDMLYGHRNDAIGYANALKEIDNHIPEILESLNNDDLLIITGDHGCDPTTEGTDHTREYVPVIVYNKKLQGKHLGTKRGFSCIAKTLSDWLDFTYDCEGDSLL